MVSPMGCKLLRSSWYSVSYARPFTSYLHFIVQWEDPPFLIFFLSITTELAQTPYLVSSTFSRWSFKSSNVGPTITTDSPAITVLNFISLVNDSRVVKTNIGKINSIRKGCIQRIIGYSGYKIPRGRKYIVTIVMNRSESETHLKALSNKD